MFQTRIVSVFKWISGTGIRIRVQAGHNCLPKKDKNVMFAEFSVKAAGFSWSLNFL
jgi:hypothetical protein